MWKHDRLRAFRPLLILVDPFKSPILVPQAVYPQTEGRLLSLSNLIIGTGHHSSGQQQAPEHFEGKALPLPVLVVVVGPPPHPGKEQLERQRGLAEVEAEGREQAVVMAPHPQLVLRGSLLGGRQLRQLAAHTTRMLLTNLSKAESITTCAYHREHHQSQEKSRLGGPSH